MAEDIALPGTYRGRRWLAAFLGVCAAVLLPISGATLFLDDAWLAFLAMGLPSLVCAYVCLAIAYGEAVAQVELRADGFSMRLPSYRGYFPNWPVRHLHAQWKDVTQLTRLTVHAHALFLPQDYVLHRISAGEREIVLLEPLPTLYRNVRGAGLNLPARQIAAHLVRKTGLQPQDRGEVTGGGLWRNLINGSGDNGHAEEKMAAANRRGSNSAHGQS